jgi:hypothetical protein
MTNEGLLNVGNAPATDAPATPPAQAPADAPATPPATDAPATPPAANDNFGNHWKEYIPEDLKDRSEWNNIKDVSDLYKNYINAQQTISKSVRMPDATSTPEDIAAFYSKLGKPSSKTEYTFEYTPAKAEYKTFNKESFDFSVFQDIADKANLTKTQYEALANAYIDINNENYINYNKDLSTKAAQELKDAEGKLRSSWGEKYNQNINAITEKVKKLYPESTLTRMQNAGLFRDPEFLEAHLKLTKMMTGDTVFIEGNAVENVPQTLQTLTEKRDKLMAEDYSKNLDQVLSLNKQIVKLKQSQSAGAAKFRG